MTTRTQSNRMTLDEALRPMQMTCSKCNGQMTVYPYPLSEGTGVCPTCSPKWLDSFAKFGMNGERANRGLEPI